ncbi:sensor histidine kinase [Chlorobium ferrooxidans]|uniref:histidine kinase n=1 Tax=Chlorobium ferrooxidans DSM 13031 TaxID=377431 RepID=Q0YS43_9CHLB|nr:ATP-binding protein [Chlorobium ferrooxidans]EAT59146.1 ATP-binding region, ATPase-like:Histidine kinase, HAMP region:Histidine kinase A-like [Chlorobium ferrooxidans DSM 13031]
MSTSIQSNRNKRPGSLKKVPEFSLRNRIAFYYTAATGFLIAIVFMIIYFTVESIVYKQFDDEIKKEILEVLSDANVSTYHFKGYAIVKDFESIRNLDTNDHDNLMNEENEDDADDGKNKSSNENTNLDTEFIQIVDTKGEVLNKSKTLSWCVLSFDPNRKGTDYFNTSFGSSLVRQAQVPLVNLDGTTEGYLIVALPLKNALRVLHDLQNIFLFAFPVIILTLFALTRLIAGKSIRPVEKIIETAEKMTQSNLHERIVLPYHHDELYRLSSTINALLDRMQDAFQREKQFTSDASHELKTPLAAVKGTLEVLIRKPREREHYESRIHFCLMELNRMARLIDQLLMLARNESSKMKPNIELLMLTPHLEDVIARIQPSAYEKNISITADLLDNIKVAADPAMLDMIFENILTNAIKYSPEGSSITLGTEQKDNTILCTVTDQGIGIPEEKLHAVFERFYRVDESRSSSTGGFGLGLSIVKKLADLQNIMVTLVSEKNRGTTFTLTFQIPKAGEI